MSKVTLHHKYLIIILCFQFCLVTDEVLECRIILFYILFGSELRVCFLKQLFIAFTILLVFVTE